MTTHMTNRHALTFMTVIFCTLAASTLRAQQFDPDPRVALELEDASAREVLSHLAGLLGLELDAAQDARSNVTTRLVNVRSSTALRVVCETAGCSWSVEGESLRVSWLPLAEDRGTASGSTGIAVADDGSGAEGTAGRSATEFGIDRASGEAREKLLQPVTLSLDGADLREVLAVFERLLEMPVVVEDGVAGQTTVELVAVPAGRALEKICAVNGCAIEWTPPAGLLIRAIDP